MVNPFTGRNFSLEPEGKISPPLRVAFIFWGIFSTYGPGHDDPGFHRPLQVQHALQTSAFKIGISLGISGYRLVQTTYGVIVEHRQGNQFTPGLVRKGRFVGNERDWMAQLKGTEKGTIEKLLRLRISPYVIRSTHCVLFERHEEIIRPLEFGTAQKIETHWQGLQPHRAGKYFGELSGGISAIDIGITPPSWGGRQRQFSIRISYIGIVSVDKFPKRQKIAAGAHGTHEIVEAMGKFNVQEVNPFETCINIVEGQAHPSHRQLIIGGQATAL